MGNKSNIVVQKENSLVNAIYRLSLEETRIFNYVIAKTNPENHCYDHVKDFTVKEFADFYSLDGANPYREVKKALKELFKRECTYYDNDTKMWVTCRLIVEYRDSREGRLSLKFSDQISDLIAVRKDFLNYKLEQTKGMSSANAIRIYEVVLNTLKRERKKSKEFTFEEIKRFLGFKESEYKEFYNFRRRVLEVAKEQINKSTDITFDFSVIKYGRYVTGCILLFDWKKNAEAEAKKLDDSFALEQEKEDIQLEKELKEDSKAINFDDNKELIKLDLAEYIEMSDRDIEYTLKLYSEEKIIEQINHTLEAHGRGEIKKSKVAHFRYFIRQRS